MKRDNNLKLKNKSLKGMTLMEVIIAMVIMAILAVILVESCVGIISNVRISKNVNHKVNVQSHDVENRSLTNNAYTKDDEISLEYNGEEGKIIVDRYSASDVPDSDPEKIKGVLDADNLKYFKLVE